MATDVSRTRLGTLPMRFPDRFAAPAPPAAGAGLGAPAMPLTIRGVQDGRELVLPSGVRLRRMTLAGAHVTERELMDVARAVMILPAQHQAMIARSGVAVELVPVAALEGGILGATSIEQDGGGPWRPTLVRVAVRSPLSQAGSPRETIGEIAQHEIGHVLAVLTGQDRGEAAAERYAMTH